MLTLDFHLKRTLLGLTTYRLALTLLFALAASLSVGQHAWLSGEHEVRVFSASENKSQPQSWAITQDHRGVMYVANNGGVLEYDGNEWRIIDMPNEREVVSIDVDERGHVWVGSYNEFGFLAPDSMGSMAYHSLRDLVPDTIDNVYKIWKVHVAENGVWFQSKRYLMFYHEGQLDVHHSSLVDGEHTTFHTTYLLEGELWVKERHVGLRRYNGTSFELVGDSAYLKHDRIYFVLPYQNNGVIVATQEGLV